ncbi:MAG: helix-turn-helix domain-containing protein [Roseiflexaceae bacterium]
MGAKVEDRRVQRTRKLLQDALTTLIVEKGYEAVTVQDIIDRVNVGRSTFYDHFLNKQALLLSGFARFWRSSAQQSRLRAIGGWGLACPCSSTRAVIGRCTVR